MKKKFLGCLLISALSCALIFFACGPDQVAGGAGAGNPPLAKVSLSIKANSAGPVQKSAAPAVRNPDGTLTILDSMGTPLTLTAVQARVWKVDVNLPGTVTCAQILNLPCADNEAGLPGPYTVDLLTGKSDSPLNLFELPAGIYKKLGVDFIQSEYTEPHVQSDTALRNLVIRGKLGHEADSGRAFEVKLNLDDELDFVDSTGINLRTDSLNVILMLLKTDQWFRGVDMAKCLDSSTVLPDSAGFYQISGDAACGGVGLIIRKSIEGSGELDKDEVLQQ